MRYRLKPGGPSARAREAKLSTCPSFDPPAACLWRAAIPRDGPMKIRLGLIALALTVPACATSAPNTVHAQLGMTGLEALAELYRYRDQDRYPPPSRLAVLYEHED